MLGYLSWDGLVVVSEGFYKCRVGLCFLFFLWLGCFALFGRRGMSGWDVWGVLLWWWVINSGGVC